MNTNQKTLAAACFLCVFTMLAFVPSGKTQSLLLADFPLVSDGADATGNSPTMTLSGISFHDHAMQIPVSGFYEATASINEFSYDSFTVALDFKPASFGYPDGTILEGGPSYRWLIFQTDESGHLEIALNNFNWIPGWTNIIQLNVWHTLMCSVDTVNGVIYTFLDGKQLPDIILGDFQFDVATSPDADFDKIFSFWDNANAERASGSAANLRVFSRALSPVEMSPLVNPVPTTKIVGDNLLIFWPIDVRGYVLQKSGTFGRGWISVIEKPVVIGNQNLIIQKLTNERHQYRLIRN
jgi:Concanavalin A-like lectin/glucanases superfamily